MLHAIYSRFGIAPTQNSIELDANRALINHHQIQTWFGQPDSVLYCVNHSPHRTLTIKHCTVHASTHTNTRLRNMWLGIYSDKSRRAGINVRVVYMQLVTTAENVYFIIYVRKMGVSFIKHYLSDICLLYKYVGNDFLHKKTADLCWQQQQKYTFLTQTCNHCSRYSI